MRTPYQANPGLEAWVLDKVSSTATSLTVRQLITMAASETGVGANQVRGALSHMAAAGDIKSVDHRVSSGRCPVRDDHATYRAV